MMWLRDMLAAIAEHPWAYCGLVVGVCMGLATFGSAVGALLRRD